MTGTCAGTHANKLNQLEQAQGVQHGASLGHKQRSEGQLPTGALLYTANPRTAQHSGTQNGKYLRMILTNEEFKGMSGPRSGARTQGGRSVEFS